MCYVIYRRGLYSESYLTQSSGRKCFGFYKGDSVQSIAKDKSGNFQFAFPKDTTVNGVSYTKGQKFNGKTFTVPVGESFEEILVNLECDVANGGWAKTTFSAPALNDNATDGVNKAQNYQEVLEYAAKLTGVKSAVIEALAYEFAHDVSKIDAGCGPQRQYAGAEWVLVLIALTVMCGHVEEKGGGLPMGMGSFPDNSFFLDPKNPTGTTTTGFTYNIPDDKTTDSYIDIMDQNLAEIILTGRDGRTAAQFQSDNGLTVDPVKTPNIATLTGVEIDVYTMSSSNRMITHPNVNKTIEAYRKIKTVVVCDQVMTPSAAFADIVLPAATHLEDVGGIGGQGEVKILKQNVLRKTMYESKRQGEINSLYLRACAQAVGTTLPKEYAKPADLDMIEASKKTFAGFASSKMYNDAVGTPAVIPSWEEFAKTGAVHIVGPADKPVMGLKHLYKPGVDIETSTGYINFWSPFWGVARRDALATLSGGSKYAAGDYTAGWRVTAPDYVPVREGYEKFFANGNVHDTFTGYNSPHSGRNYKLQFMTNKARNRAHTCQDNVAIIKDQFEQKAYMNPLDAAERFIKDGDYVYVYNDRGCTKIRAAVTHYITPGVISVEHGAWYRASTDPKEQVKIWISTGYDTDAVEKTVPVDVGGCENLLTDDRFVYDVLFINQTAGLHAGPVEVSLTKPE